MTGGLLSGANGGIKPQSRDCGEILVRVQADAVLLRSSSEWNPGKGVWVPEDAGWSGPYLLCLLSIPGNVERPST